MLIYTPTITNRIQFIFKFLLRDVIGISEVRFTDNSETFLAYEGPKLSYAAAPLADELFFSSRSLLIETGLRNYDIQPFEWNGEKIFFPVGKNASLPFDIFAASFYLVSRYEEYLPTIRDKYDRFEASESLAYKNNFLTQPVINRWAMHLRRILLSRYPGLQLKPAKYCFVPTIDIDNAFAYREKGIMRICGGYLRALSQLNFKEISERTKVHFGLQKDPYDTFDHLGYLEKKYRLDPIYFFLVADYGINDKNVPLQSRRFRTLIKSISDAARIGVHPSFASNYKPEVLAKEIQRLSKILNRDVTHSRQHFLKITFPHTYRNLIDLDLTDDYSMGYASQIGFRAGTCTPFNFYDLDYETETKLKIHPFQVMEATLKYYMKVSPDEVLDKVKPIIEEVRKVNGTFMTLWHNETLSDQKQWSGWKDVYEKIIQEATA